MKDRNWLPGMLALTLVGYVAGGGPAAAETMDLALVEKAASDAVTDTGAAGDSVGDILTFNNEVLENGQSVGRDNGWCVRTVVGKTWECTWTTTLSDGQITVQGPFNDLGDSVFVVTGGTGNFAGAFGSMDLHPRDEKGSEYDFVFHLKRLGS